MYKERIEAYFADKQEQIVADICRLIRVKSEREPAKPGMPFGEGPYNALMESKKLAEKIVKEEEDFMRELKKFL